MGLRYALILIILCFIRSNLSLNCYSCLDCSNLKEHAEFSCTEEEICATYTFTFSNGTGFNYTQISKDCHQKDISCEGVKTYHESIFIEFLTHDKIKPEYSETVFDSAWIWDMDCTTCEEDLCNNLFLE